MTFPVYATGPLPYAAVGALALALAWKRLPMGWRVGGATVEIGLVLLMTPVVAGLLTRVIAARPASFGACAPPPPDAIVVLAGGFERAARGPDDFGALQKATLQRVFSGVALWHRHPHARLVFAGGGERGVREADAMASLAMQLGVPRAAIQREARSHDTWENARNVAALTPSVPRRIWLVTSPLHMPRALGAFRAWGFDACAAPAGPTAIAIPHRPSDFIPRANAARNTAHALHELIGGWDYAWRERRLARSHRARTSK